MILYISDLTLDTCPCLQIPLGHQMQRVAFQSNTAAKLGQTSKIINYSKLHFYLLAYIVFLVVFLANYPYCMSPG